MTLIWTFPLVNSREQMMSIQILPPNLAARIAAGEVIERPASVVKELIENSLDAGSTQITVEVSGSGLDSIVVADDGMGIAEPDTDKLFHRHATSKLREPADLTSIATLGFRGEALYSISSVSEIAILTRRRDATQGTLIRTDHQNLPTTEPKAAPPGTTVWVSQLFRDIPARRKFLRTPRTESGRIASVLSLYALACPEVKFTLKMENRVTFASPGQGSIREAAIAVYGAREIDEFIDLTPAAIRAFSITGLLSPPGIHRSTRNHVTLFANGRPTSNRKLTHSVVEAYHGLLPTGRNPIAMVFISVPAEEIDVNVHPTKAEVRFLDEDAVFSAVQRGIRDTLILEPSVVKINSPSFGAVASEESRHLPYYSPSSRTGMPSALHSISQKTFGDSDEREAGKHNHRPLMSKVLPLLRVLGQIRQTYIVAEGPQGLFLIDQHAGHECIRYEQLKKAAVDQPRETQGLLDPILVELQTHQIETVLGQKELFTKYGWELEAFGQRSLLIRTVPAQMTNQNHAQEFVDAVDALMSDEPHKSWEERITTVVACHTSVRAGIQLSHLEMIEMIKLLEKTQQPLTCPHGRPTMIHIDAHQLEHEFRRA